jgi:hypothetical protein
MGEASHLCRANLSRLPRDSCPRWLGTTERVTWCNSAWVRRGSFPKRGGKSRVLILLSSSLAHCGAKMFRAKHATREIGQPSASHALTTSVKRWRDSKIDEAGISTSSSSFLCQSPAPFSKVVLVWSNGHAMLHDHQLKVVAGV